jgi:hypothetical protein
MDGSTRCRTYSANDGCSEGYEKLGPSEVEARRRMERRALNSGLPLEWTGSGWVICYPEAGYEMFGVFSEAVITNMIEQTMKRN